MLKYILFFCLITSGFLRAQILFENEALSLGLNNSYGNGIFAGGVSFVDFNDDGWDDLSFSSGSGDDLYFYENNNGVYSLVSLGINHTGRSKQVTWLDYDNDGDNDFFVVSELGANKFFRNKGAMIFEDITATCGMFTDDQYTIGASWGDIDKDGRLDVFISSRDTDTGTHRNYLYNNTPTGFVDITLASGIALTPNLSFCSVMFDYDNDGDVDIYIANDKIPRQNLLYRNNNDGTFTDVSTSSGAGIFVSAMSATIGDYNNDGWFDIYVTNTDDGNVHLKNNGDGTFSDVTTTMGTSFNSIGWGSVFLDADCDTDLDLYVSGMPDGSGAFASAAFYENNSLSNFTEPINPGFVGDTAESYSNAIGDVNNDGLADIVVVNQLPNNNFLWVNKTVTTNNWLKVNLKGVTNNLAGIGSRIEIAISGNKQYRYNACGEGYISQNSNTEFFGLGAAVSIDYIKVTWLNGIVDYIENVPANQSITIIEGSNPLSVQEFNTSNSFDIFPNPFKDQFEVRSNNIKEEGIVELFDITGRSIKKMKIKTNSMKIDMSSFSESAYFLKLTIGDIVETKQVIKK